MKCSQLPSLGVSSLRAPETPACFLLMLRFLLLFCWRHGRLRLLVRFQISCHPPLRLTPFVVGLTQSPVCRQGASGNYPAAAAGPFRHLTVICSQHPRSPPRKTSHIAGKSRDAGRGSAPSSHRAPPSGPRGTADQGYSSTSVPLGGRGPFCTELRTGVALGGELGRSTHQPLLLRSGTQVEVGVGLDPKAKGLFRVLGWWGDSSCCSPQVTVVPRTLGVGGRVTQCGPGQWFVTGRDPPLSPGWELGICVVSGALAWWREGPSARLGFDEVKKKACRRPRPAWVSPEPTARFRLFKGI